MLSVVRKHIHSLFEAGAFIKALGAITDIVLGILFLTLGRQTVRNVIAFIFGDELTEHAKDPFWSSFIHGFSGITVSVQHLWATIFIVYGTITLIFVAGLILEKFWIFPIAITALMGLVFYQIFHIFYTHSILLTLSTLYDIVFIWLVFQEYYLQKHKPLQ
ncbi:MAG: DUF2127 domain-containing protein [Patescibacteria group bacterium]|nr:DUF2127 domain-containing protein [Patescibacteria group bacterium]MDE2437956.1 DUF2127 domain-containing protein [Patescibacteria group bacterium]